MRKPAAERVRDSEARKKDKGLSKAWEWGYWKQFPEDREKLRKYAERLRKAKSATCLAKDSVKTRKNHVITN